MVGEGDLPRKGHRVQITYKLTLPTGEVLDSTVLMRQLVVLSPRNLELELVTFAMEWIKRFKVFVFVLDDD